MAIGDDQKTVELSRPAHTTTRAPRLRVVAGPSMGRACVVAHALATVGRHATNDLVVDDPGVSGVHLRIVRVGEQLRVRDEGSTNGTWIGSVRVFDAEIAKSTELRIGETRIVVDSDDVVAAVASERDSYGTLVGRSTSMRELFATVERIAPKEIGVLISGDTGTGKEEVARAIHHASGRSGSFVAVDATALPETLAEKLLFGDEGDELPLLASAAGGTLFLDNVGEFSASVQARLLRTLESRSLTNARGVSRPLEARVIAATSRDLRHAVEEKRFRDDLYFRLAQLRIALPPLRDRREDIPLLTNALLRRMATPVAFRLDDEAVEYLSRQPFPGNVRELNNILVAATALATDGVIRRRDVATDNALAGQQQGLNLARVFSDAKDQAIVQFETAYLRALMTRTGGNLSKAARESDLARHHLRDLLKKRGLYGVDWSSGEGDG